MNQKNGEFLIWKWHSFHCGGLGEWWVGRISWCYLIILGRHRFSQVNLKVSIPLSIKTCLSHSKRLYYDVSSHDCFDPHAHNCTEDSAMTFYFGVFPVYSLARSVILPSTDNTLPIIIIIPHPIFLQSGVILFWFSTKLKMNPYIYSDTSAEYDHFDPMLSQ